MSRGQKVESRRQKAFSIGHLTFVIEVCSCCFVSLRGSFARLLRTSTRVHERHQERFLNDKCQMSNDKWKMLFCFLLLPLAPAVCRLPTAC